MARFVAVVGARSLPASWASRVVAVVRELGGRGVGIGSGGAVGADLFALGAVVRAGRAACVSSMIYLPGDPAQAPRACRGLLNRFSALGGAVVPGALGREASQEATVAALKARTRALIGAAAGVVAFLHGPSRGTVFTLHCAISRGLPVVVFLCGGGAVLPAGRGGAWIPLRCASGVWAGAFRWAPRRHATAGASNGEELASALRSLREIFRVPDTGSPVHDTMTHIASLSQGDRLWFERCEVLGEKVLAPHENATDGKPSALTIPALRRRFWCDARVAFEYGELLLALEADRHVIAAYAERVDRQGIEAVCRELRDLVVELDLLESGEDPVEEAHELPSEDTEVADSEDGEADGANAVPGAIGYHVVGDLFETEDAEESWEAEQPEWYQALVERIARAATEDALAAMALEIRSLPLTRDQAGVAWTAWRIRRGHLESALPLGRTARGILARIGAANGAGRDLAHLGTWLYRAQRIGSPRLALHEWRAIWTAYREHRTRHAGGARAGRPGRVMRLRHERDRMEADASGWAGDTPRGSEASWWLGVSLGTRRGSAGTEPA